MILWTYFNCFYSNAVNVRILIDVCVPLNYVNSEINGAIKCIIIIIIIIIIQSGSCHYYIAFWSCMAAPVECSHERSSTNSNGK